MPFEPFYGRKVLALSPTILSLDHQQTEKERAFRLGAQTGPAALLERGVGSSDAVLSSRTSHSAGTVLGLPCAAWKPLTTVVSTWNVELTSVFKNSDELK